jgi:glycosyltransferase involved in cell wall biosynthesis
LFVHQNYPGQFLHLLLKLAADKTNQLIFITETNVNDIPGVQKFCYQKPEFDTFSSEDAMEFEMAVRRARIVQHVARTIRDLGFTPDIIIGHHGWGELLNMQDVWPGVPLLGYFEFFYHDRGLDVGFDREFPALPGGLARVRLKNAVNLLALANPGHGQTPTQFQLSTYPDWAQQKITLLREGVYLNLACPKPSVREEAMELDGFRIEPGDTLVTYVARDLEPYRGFHTMMRALPRLHRLRPDLKVVMVGGDGVSYGARLSDGTTWREFFMREVSDVIDHSRVHFPGRVPYETFIRLLQRSDAHVYMTYPFVLSWSLREAMACGCAIVGSDTEPVSEFVKHRQTGYLVRFPDAVALADGVAEVLENQKLAGRLRRNARAWAEKNLSMPHYLAEYQQLIDRLVAAR